MAARIVRVFCSVAIVAISAGITIAQPQIAAEGIRFIYRGGTDSTVALVGDFNGWSKAENPLARDADGLWSAVVRLRPGIFQYKFLVDGTRYELDPGNPATIDNYNNTAKNSVFVLTDKNEVLLSAVPPSAKSNPEDRYPPARDKKVVYLNIIWHQHQPLYINPETDQLTGPWVRTHATKDYYDMAAMLRGYRDVHCTINLTSSLLLQLREYYLKRLEPYVNAKNNTIDVAGFLAKWKGKTDPWIDIALKPTSSFDHTDKDYLYRNTWNAFSISDVILGRFPEYLALRNKWSAAKDRGDDLFNEQELREIKFWFYTAYFDPDFLVGPVRLPDGSVCDLHDLVALSPDGSYRLRRKVTDEDCLRMVAETYKVMAGVIPVHRELRYSAVDRKGQVELITTPYCHPILPLIFDSDLAKVCQPDDPLPPRFAYPQDARAHVAKAVRMYRDIFGVNPTGMWPGEGSVAQPILPLLRENGIEWTASDVKVLVRSDPPNAPNTTPYRFNAGEKPISLVFRDTELSDRIGFKYQNYEGEEAADDFIRTILERAPGVNDPDVLVTVILDGENAWEWYRKDNDGKGFLHALYRKLSVLYAQRRIVTTTPIEYIRGNPGRGIMPHPASEQAPMKWLWPGSWINANYDTWIGEPEENTAWTYLLRARQDLEQSGLKQPDPRAKAPAEGSPAWYAYRSWESLYAAEGSDWFWWYGNDQTAPGGDKPFDTAFLIHLNNIYAFAQRAGADITSPGFAPIIQENQSVAPGQGTMAQSTLETGEIIFMCDAAGLQVPRGISIAGSIPQLGSWSPNAVMMYDDGTHGDEKAGDGVWSLLVSVPVGKEIEYKYTNSGESGKWIPGEEFSTKNRTVTLAKKTASPFLIKATFGK